MYVSHVRSALILIISMTTLHVCDGTGKRHLKNSPNPGRPRTEEPLCRHVCANISAYCERSCYPSNVNPKFTTVFPGGATTTGFIDNSKYNCLSKCMDEDEPIVFEDESCTASGKMLEPQDDKATQLPEEVEVDVSALTMADRCHMEPWVNSTVCEFDREYPVVSKKVFDVNKPKLTLCTGSKVLKGRNGFSLKKSFSQGNQPNTGIFSRKERSISNPMGSSGVSLEDALQNEGSRGPLKFQQSTDQYCPTLFNFESPKSATHYATKLVVDIYFYAGYSQWFQQGTCGNKTPQQSLPRNIKSHCDVAYTAVKAWLMIDPKIFLKRDEVQNCGTVKNASYLVCNDWVLLPTHCKHFFEV